jgi:pilus assembly protein TadC
MSVALAALAGAVALSGRPDGSRRLPGPPVKGPRPRAPLSGSVACLLAGVVATALVGLPAGLLGGLVIAVVGPTVLARLEPVSVRRERRQLVTELPLALDLLGACLAGGASLEASAAAVAQALPGICGDRLGGVCQALAVGTSPPQAWLLLDGGATDDPLAATARTLARAADGGTPVAAALGRLAAEARAVSRAAASEAARRVGVLVVAPLGLCFLPAFVLLGIVPVVAGLAGPLLATF